MSSPPLSNVLLLVTNNCMAIGDFEHCARIQDRAIKLAKNLANRFTDDKLYLVSYLHEQHWMLILINPSANTTQCCNYFGGLPRSEAVDLTERALVEFHKIQGNDWDTNLLKWTVVPVPSQPGLTFIWKTHLHIKAGEQVSIQA
ncbi:hypothetical protein ACFE04_003632 [Oxalis oulophora]